MLRSIQLLAAFPFLILLLAGTHSNRSAAGINTEIKTATAWTVSWSHDDRFAAIGNSGGELSIYETKNWKKIKSWHFRQTTISKTAWNPRYPILAVAAFSQEKEPGIIQLYDAANNEVIRYLPDTLFGRGVSWSPTGEEVAFAGRKGRISLFTKSGQFRKTLSFENEGSLFDIDWHPAQNLLLAVEEDIFIIDTDRDSLVARYDDGSVNKGILCCAWHPSGQFFVTGDYGHENEGAEPSYLKYWNNNGQLQKRIKESRSEYRNVKWRKDGKYLAAAADVLLLLNEKGELIRKTRFDNNNLWGVGWNNKGDKILSGGHPGHIRITDIRGRNLKAFTQ